MTTPLEKIAEEKPEITNPRYWGGDPLLVKDQYFSVFFF